MSQTDSLQGVSHYQYAPLQSPSCTRLVTLAPGQYDDPISISVSEVQIGAAEPYEALSYEWRETTGSVPVRCNGEAKVLVTSNLKDALLALRLADGDRRLWIDAVCINQADANEKSTHVLRMKEIYQNATTVLIWVGLATDPITGMAFDNAIPRLVVLWERVRERGVNISRPDTFRQNLSDDEIGGLGLEDELPWHGIVDLISRDYFSRTWIVQEVVVSKEALLVCGSHHIPWATFVAAVQALVACGAGAIVPGFADPRVESKFLNLYYLVVAQRRFQDRNRLHMLGLAVTFQTLQASDPRDKIYAMLGIVAPHERVQGQIEHVNITPDYRKDVVEVYTETAAYVIWERQDLYLWSMQAPASRKELKGLPSWVPDWSARQNFENYRKDIGSIQRLINGHPKTEGKSLWVDACVLGYVVWSVVAGIPDTNEGPAGAQHPAAVVKVFSEVASHLERNGIGLFDFYRGSPDMLVVQAIWRTLNPEAHPPQYYTENFDPIEQPETDSDDLAVAEIRFLSCVVLAIIHASILSELKRLGVDAEDADVAAATIKHVTEDEAIPEVFKRGLLEMQFLLKSDQALIGTFMAEYAKSARLDTSFFILSDGSFGIAEAGEVNIEAGEELAIAVLGGAFTPMLLRRCETEGRGQGWWEIKGSVFVEWLLDANTADLGEEGEHPARIEIR